MSIARFTSLLLVLLAALMLAACGGDDDSGSDDSGSKSDTTEETTEETTDDSEDEGDDTSAGGQTLELGVDGNNLKFDKEELTATAGTVTIKLSNTSSIPHNVALKDKDGKDLEAGELVGEGETSEVTVDLEPGTYTYVCTPHESAGMTGTLTVT